MNLFIKLEKDKLIKQQNNFLIEYYKIQNV